MLLEPGPRLHSQTFNLLWVPCQPYLLESRKMNAALRADLLAVSKVSAANPYLSYLASSVCPHHTTHHNPFSISQILSYTIKKGLDTDIHNLFIVRKSKITCICDAVLDVLP